MIVTLAADGIVVGDADDCGELRAESALDHAALRAVLERTGTGRAGDGGTAWLDAGVLRSRARLVATAPDWPQRWSALLDRARAAGLLSDDGRALRVEVGPAAEPGTT